MSKHYNPLEEANRNIDREQYRSQGDTYTKMTMVVTEIRDKSVFVKTRVDTIEQSFGRSLLHAKSDDMLSAYKGPLPQEFALTIRTWWAEKMHGKLA